MKTENYRPTIVLLQIGGNDLDKYLFDQDAFLQKLAVIISDLKSWGVLELGIMNIFSGLIYISGVGRCQKLGGAHRHIIYVPSVKNQYKRVVFGYMVI